MSENLRILAQVFHMGGLGGIPFTGKTGFAAFSHHVPDGKSPQAMYMVVSSCISHLWFPSGGNLFILFAPHIGVSDTGELGKYSRRGQIDRDGTACGAACGALKFCEDCKVLCDAGEIQVEEIKAPEEQYGDYQEEFIIAQVVYFLCQCIVVALSDTFCVQTTVCTSQRPQQLYP